MQMVQRWLISNKLILRLFIFIPLSNDVFKLCLTVVMVKFSSFSLLATLATLSSQSSFAALDLYTHANGATVVNINKALLSVANVARNNKLILRLFIFIPLSNDVFKLCLTVARLLKSHRAFTRIPLRWVSLCNGNTEKRRKILPCRKKDQGRFADIYLASQRRCR
jgi:hypothetical protein